MMGGAMDRDKFASFSDTVPWVGIKIIANIALTYKLEWFSLDGSNAFQSTRADKPGQPRPYCDQAPGFVKYGPKGERLCCEILVALQGRIDAARLHSDEWRSVFLSIGLVPSVWMPRTYIFDNAPLSDTDAPLEELLASAGKFGHDKDYKGRPCGFMVFGTHVDDGFGCASSR